MNKMYNMQSFSSLKNIINCLLKNSLYSVYVDMGTTASDTVSLNLAFTDNTALTNQRFYEIKITQIECTSEYKYVLLSWLSIFCCVCVYIYIFVGLLISSHSITVASPDVSNTMKA